MKIEILDRAEVDLLDGYYFYESQQTGLGDYFLNSLYSDIESLQLYAGIQGFKPHRFYLCGCGLSPGRELDKDETEIILHFVFPLALDRIFRRRSIAQLPAIRKRGTNLRRSQTRRYRKI